MCLELRVDEADCNNLLAAHFEFLLPVRRGLCERKGLDARAQRLLFFLPSPEARRSVRVPLVALGASGRLVVRTDLQVRCSNGRVVIFGLVALCWRLTSIPLQSALVAIHVALNHPTLAAGILRLQACSSQNSDTYACIRNVCCWVQDQHVYVFRTEALRAALAERLAATSLQQARTEPVTKC